MLYLAIDTHKIKLLYFKKTLLGHYETAFYEKGHQVNLISEKGEIINSDVLASAIKEGMLGLSKNNVKEKEVTLILPGNAFRHLRTEVPIDIAPSALETFLKDKASAQIDLDVETMNYDTIVMDNATYKHVNFFAVSRELIGKYQNVLSLLNLRLSVLVPEPVTYFKLFDKTLRKEKQEIIMYASFNKPTVIAYFFDNYGSLTSDRLSETVDTSLEKVLRKQVDIFQSQGKKINRLILSGVDSEQVRQDTFTKDVGVWTNPLKRIIPQFYQDYLKVFTIASLTSLLQFDTCIGAFIFTIENKNFSLLRSKAGSQKRSFAFPSSGKIPFKETLIFAASFILSFGAFFLVSQKNPLSSLSKASPPFFSSPTQTPTPLPPSPTPTPSIKRADLNIKLLNGSGVRGKASEIKEILQNKGYGEVLTGNADEFNYDVTEIQVKKGKKDISSMVTADLKEYTSSPKVTTLDQKEAADVIIIFGKDFK